MQPLGRKRIRLPHAKWHVKVAGKHVTAWWENIVNITPKRERFNSKRDIQDQLNLS